VSRKRKLVKISGGSDLIEAKYHFTCLTKYRNHYRALQRAQACSHSSSSASAQAKVPAFAELVVHIENNLEQGTYLFKLGELYDDYEKRIRQYGIKVQNARTVRWKAYYFIIP